jgi:hypothetical protein
MAKKTAPQADLFSQIEDTSAKKIAASSLLAGFNPVQKIVKNFKLDDKGGYITQEFQDFGYRMAAELDDTTRASLYMRLSKTVQRTLLEKALSFVSDAPNVKSKSRLFMWKLKQLREEQKLKEKQK